MKESFTSRDLSVTAPTLKRWFSDPILAFIPIGVSPNALTLAGGACALTATAIIWALLNEVPWIPVSEFAGLVISAVLLVAYAICDQLDGLQARRRQSSNAFGDFLDHWVDAILANLVPAPAAILMGFELETALLIATICALAFWANNWETRNENSRTLPTFGGLEFIWVGVIFLLVSAFFGRDVWSFGIGILNGRNFLLALVTYALVRTFISGINSNLKQVGDLIMPLFSVLPLTIWLVVLMRDSVPDIALISIGLALFGLIFARHTGDLIRHLWVGIKPGGIDWVTAICGVLLLIVAFFVETHSGKYLSAVLLAILLVYSVTRLVWQSMYTYLALNPPIVNAEDVAAKSANETVKARVMVDMSATILHHGHIRLLQQASEFGEVIVGLTSDVEIENRKGSHSVLDFDSRKEIVQSIRWVAEVVETPWLITDEILEQHNIDYLVHGDDNSNSVTASKLKIFPRTENISSQLIREKLMKPS